MLLLCDATRAHSHADIYKKKNTYAEWYPTYACVPEAW